MMPNPQTPNRNANDGRLMLGGAGLLFIPGFAFGAWQLLFMEPRPKGLAEWGIRIFLDELTIVATLFFSLGFLWAISSTRRLKALLDAVSVRFAWIVIPSAISLFAAVARFLLLG